MSKDRVKNTATSQDVCRVFRGAVSSLADEKYLKSDLAKIVESYEVAIVDLLRLTDRPNKAVLKAGAALAFAADTLEETSLFADRIYDAIKMCKEKAKSMTSGKKLPEAVRRVCSFLNKQPSSETMDVPRRLSTSSRASNGSEDSARKAKKKVAEQIDAEALKAEVLKLYGLAPSASSSSSSSRPAGQEVSAEAMVIMSSQEASPVRQKEAKQKELVAPEEESFVDYFDNRQMALCRAFSSGRKEHAQMSSGATGFALARFPGTSKSIQTEMPNALLEVKRAVAFKRPAAPLSAKVAKKAKEAAAKEAAANEALREEEVQEEGGEEEDLEEDPELPPTQEYHDVNGEEAIVALDDEPPAAANVAVQAPGKKAAFDVDGLEIPWAVRLRIRPFGCRKCRAAPGCTPCCYRYSKFKLDPADV